MDYQEMAADFLRATGTEIIKKFVGRKKYCHDDNEPRNVWNITITRKDKFRSWTFDFGDSIMNTYKPFNNNGRRVDVDLWKLEHPGRSLPKPIPPDDYSILACISSDSHCEYKDEYEFGNEMGYEIHSWDDYKNVRDIYEKLKKAAGMCQLMFGDVMDQLEDIQ